MELIYKNNNLCTSLGHNGYMYCHGIHTIEYENAIRLLPINSKGTSYSCFIEIPKEEIDNLIKELIKLK